MGRSSVSRRRGTRPVRESEQRRRRIVVSILLIVGLILLLSARPAFHWFKANRAAQLAEKANALAEAGKLNAAADNFRAALQLDPVSYPALKGAARLATRAGRAEGLDLWEQVVRTPNATVDDRQQYAQRLLDSGRPRSAGTIIEKLVRDAPNSATFELASRYWRSVGDAGKALQFARLAVQKSPNDGLTRFHLAELLARSSDESDHAEARKILWDLTETTGPARQAAIEALASAPELTETERQKVLELLRTLPPNNIRDELLAADVKLRAPGADTQKVYDEVIARWNQGSPSEVADLARWLTLHQQSERVLTLFPVETALKNNQLLLVRLDALASLQRWNQIDALLSGPNLTLDPSVLECFRARSAAEQNAALDAELHWNHAVAFAAGDALKLRFVADFAQQSRAGAVALKAYDQLTKFPEHAAFAYRGIEQLSAGGTDVAVQRAAAEKMKSVTGHEPNAIAQLAYVNLLAGRQVDENTTTATQLVQKYPDRLSFRVAAALGFLKQHDPGLALEQFKGPAGAPSIDWRKTPPAWRAVYAATLMANEQAAAAQEIIKTIPMNELSPEERALVESR